MISRIHLSLPNAYKLMCFDRNVNGNRDVKFLIGIICILLHRPKKLTLVHRSVFTAPEKPYIKGQVISKGFFGFFNFFRKTNKNTSHISKNEFICLLFGTTHGLTIGF